MRYRRLLPLALAVAAVACGVAESPTGPSAAAAFVAPLEEGKPPPPPIDTQFVVLADGEAGTAAGRFFVNQPGIVAWIDFTSTAQVLASPNARLMYNARTGATIGTGQLVFARSGRVLDLSTVTLSVDGVRSGFGRCPARIPSLPPNPCVNASFTFDGGSGLIYFGSFRSPNIG
jgi:hypothetical protein